MCPLYLLLLFLLTLRSESIKPTTSLISIRGAVNSAGILQSLPLVLTKSWKTWTFDGSFLEAVEDETDGDGWVACTSYDEMYLPADLPLPNMRAALGLVVINGVPRYAMPSVIASLDTPGRMWRNRGLKSLPRANNWIDLFGESADLARFRFHCFGQFAPDVRFLEDQDGAAAWENLMSAKEGGMLRPPLDNTGIEVATAITEFKKFLKSVETNPISEGYHIVDIPIPSARPLRLRGNTAQVARRIKSFLTDLLYPSDLLGQEDLSMVDGETIGALDIMILPVAAGGSSEFLPEAYLDLFEPGNIILNSSS